MRRGVWNGTEIGRCGRTWTRGVWNEVEMKHSGEG